MPILPNPRHEAFCQQIAKGLSATQAYINAGYSENGSGQSGDRLLRNAQVCSRIAELREQISASVQQETVIDRVWLIKKLQAVHDHCTQPKTYDSSGANKSLELLGKTMGAYLDRKELSGTLRLEDLDGDALRQLVNDARLKYGEEVIQ